jgi:adenosylcobinamide kinase/adenosylcobinamide-phosphate guanylyltransferase
MIALVLGGARSGKSAHAQQLASELSPAPVMLATSRKWDPDHEARIARHKADRGPAWTTIEEERQLSRAELAGRVVVVDCVTMWLTNVFADIGWKDWEAAHRTAVEELERAFAVEATWVYVSNELGMAPHATTESARKFVDVQGWINQRIAARADSVVLMVAGLPVAVKGRDLRELAAARRP